MRPKAATSDDVIASGGAPNFSAVTVSADRTYKSRCPDTVAKKLASGVP